MKEKLPDRIKMVDGIRSLVKVPLDQVDTVRPDRALAYSAAVNFNELKVGGAFYGKDNKWHVILQYKIEYPRIKAREVKSKPEIFKTLDGKLWTSMVTGGKYDNDVNRDVYLS